MKDFNFLRNHKHKHITATSTLLNFSYTFLSKQADLKHQFTLAYSVQNHINKYHNNIFTRTVVYDKSYFLAKITASKLAQPRRSQVPFWTVISMLTWAAKSQEWVKCRVQNKRNSTSKREGNLNEKGTSIWKQSEISFTEFR